MRVSAIGTAVRPSRSRRAKITWLARAKAMSFSAVPAISGLVTSTSVYVICGRRTCSAAEWAAISSATRTPSARRSARIVSAGPTRPNG